MYMYVSNTQSVPVLDKCLLPVLVPGASSQFEKKNMKSSSRQSTSTAYLLCAEFASKSQVKQY